MCFDIQSKGNGPIIWQNKIWTLWEVFVVFNMQCYIFSNHQSVRCVWFACVSCFAVWLRFIDLVSKLKPKQFMPDVDIPELLVFVTKTDLHDHILYTTGDIILQDKVSARITSSPCTGCGGWIVMNTGFPSVKSNQWLKNWYLSLPSMALSIGMDRARTA